MDIGILLCDPARFCFHSGCWPESRGDTTAAKYRTVVDCEIQRFARWSGICCAKGDRCRVGQCCSSKSATKVLERLSSDTTGRPPYSPDESVFARGASRNVLFIGFLMGLGFLRAEMILQGRGGEVHGLITVAGNLGSTELSSIEKSGSKGTAPDRVD